jgi:ribosome biogenesis GTPase
MSLIDLGWREELARHFHHDNPDWVPARVAVTHRNRYLLYSALGELQAVAAGTLAGRPVTGDWVAAFPGPPGDLARIERILPRHSVFRRKPPVSGGRKLGRFEGETRIVGGATEEQVIAANMDVLCIVTALDADYSLARIRRYLVLARASAAETVILLNKVDLADPGLALAELSALARTLGVSARTGEGLRAVEALLQPARTGALVGSSGVGKSSLVNALLEEDRQYVSPKSRSTGKGRHTTTRRELVPLPRGGFLLDTPGMREVQLWAEAEDLSEAFESLETLASRCRFADCRHQTEPGCAVKEAVEGGRLEAWTLEEYGRLSREVRYLALRRRERLQSLQRRR